MRKGRIRRSITISAPPSPSASLQLRSLRVTNTIKCKDIPFASCPGGNISPASSSDTAPMQETLLGKDRRPPPIYITLFLVFLFQLCLALFTVGVLIVGLFQFLTILSGFLFYWIPDDE
jgi:hypothetical protein